MSNFVAAGVVAFSNLTEFDVYQGKSTGRYSVVIVLDEPSASKLADQGVKLKDYNDTKQRKFSTKYKVDVVDTEDEPIQGEIPWGSDVRVLYSTGPAHPVNGTPTYLNKVRLVSYPEGFDPSTAEVPDEF